MTSKRRDRHVIVSTMSGTSTPTNVRKMFEEFDALRGAPIWVIDAMAVPGVTEQGLDESFTMLQDAAALGLEIMVVATKATVVRRNSATVGSATGVDMRLVGSLAEGLALADELARARG